MKSPVKLKSLFSKLFCYYHLQARPFRQILLLRFKNYKRSCPLSNYSRRLTPLIPTTFPREMRLLLVFWWFRINMKNRHEKHEKYKKYFSITFNRQLLDYKLTRFSNTCTKINEIRVSKSFWLTENEYGDLPLPLHHWPVNEKNRSLRSLGTTMYTFHFTWNIL